MSGKKVGVKVAEEHRLDGQALCGGFLYVLVDVSLWIDDGCSAAVLVADQI